MTTAKRKPAAPRTRSTAKRRTRKRSTSLYPRRRPSRPGLPTTIGTAIGTLVVTSLLDASWPVRLGLVALALVLGAGYVVWRARREPPVQPEPAPTQPTRDPGGPVQPAS